jgi:hypothetical protein
VGVNVVREIEQNEPEQINIWPIEEKFDISHLPPGSQINIVTNNVIDETYDYIDGNYYKNADDGSFSYDSNDPRYHDKRGVRMVIRYSQKALSSSYGKKLIVEYSYHEETVNEMEISSLADKQLSVRLEDNTLYLDYTYDKNIKAAYVESWSFMKQFDVFKDRDLYKKIFGNSGGGNGGNIHVYVGA